MASIESLGVGSGLLTTDLVDKIVTAEREATDLRLDLRQATTEAKITAYGEFRSALDKVRSAASGLSSQSFVKSTTATSSDDSALTATTNSLSEPGSYQVAIDNVAKSHSLASGSYASVTDTIGTGTLTFKIGTTTYAAGTGDYVSFEQNPDIAATQLEITSENNTLSGIRDAINKDVEGVSASIVYDGSGYRLLLTSDSTGEEYSMEVTVSGDAGLQSLAYNASQESLDETQKGEDAVLRVNGLQITSSDNQVDQAIQGVILNVQQTTASALSLNVSRDSGAVADKMEDFVAAYNEFKAVYEQVNSFDPEEQEAGLLLGDSAIRRAYNEVRQGLTKMVSGLASGTFRSLTEVGLGTDQENNFELTFNRSTFISALNSNAENVSGLLATQQTLADSQIKYVTKSADTQPGEYDINISQAATQAKWTGLTSSELGFGSGLTIGGSNDEFTLVLNGTSKTVTLEQGDYSTGDDLALMIQNAISTAFAGTGQSATVTFDDDNDRLEITSSKFGSSSSLNITSVDPILANTLGLSAAGEGQVSGQYFSNLSDPSFGATTPSGTLAVSADEGIDFSDNTVSFDLTLAGTSADGVHSISLNEDWSDILDTDGNIVADRDRGDVLTYIQSELNDAGLNGVVTAEFDSSNRLRFYTEPTAGTQTIDISNIVTTGTDPLGLQAGNGTSGVATSGANFVISYSNRMSDVTSGTITVPDATYETASDLAAAIESAIDADAAIQAGVAGATTTKGNRSLSSDIDFTADPAQVQFKLNGTEHIIDVTSETGSGNLADIQSALDTELGAGVVTASLELGGLVLTTNATGSAQRLDITKDGMGATTNAGTQDLSVGVDFSADPASFRLTVDGVDIDVTVDGDGTAGTNDGVSNLAVIQQALDDALTSAGGGGEFQAGDVVARLDGANHLYFETLSKNGVETETTYGADASIELSNVSDPSTLIGLTAHAANLNGRDTFGLDLGLYQGFDADSTVTYEQDDDGNGRFVISFGNDTTVSFDSLSDAAKSQLGFSTPTGNETSAVTGKDVAGTINGFSAVGSGQLLTASDGSDTATAGYLQGGPGADFTSAVTIDGTNDNLTVVVDGTESGAISLTQGVYTTGASLASELQSKINSDATLSAANKSIKVSYDADTDKFKIESVSTGSDSSVRLSQIDSAAIDVFGMTTTTAGVQGKDASSSDNPAAGLMLRVTGSKTGDRGSIKLVQGIFDEMNLSLKNMLGSSGLITQRESGLDNDLETIAEGRQDLNTRMAALEARLKSKFLFNDQVISKLKTTENFLSQQFELLAATVTGKK